MQVWSFVFLILNFFSLYWLDNSNYIVDLYFSTPIKLLKLQEGKFQPWKAWWNMVWFKASSKQHCIICKSQKLNLTPERSSFTTRSFSPLISYSWIWQAKSSAHKMNKYRDNDSPYLIPRIGKNLSPGIPLTRTENKKEELHNFVPWIHYFIKTQFF